MRKALIPVLLIIAFSGVLCAQSTGQSVRIFLTDTEGMELPDVRVTLAHPETGIRRTALSDKMGRVFFPSTPLGTYRLRAELTGFEPYESSLEVHLGVRTHLSLTLRIATSEEDLKRAEEKRVPDPGSGAEGMRVVTDQLIETLPVQREISSVALLAPGTVPGDTAFDGRPPGQNLVSFGGASVAENLYQLNGLNITNFRNGLGSTVVPMEFLEEIQIQTGGYEAEFGRSTGAFINMLSKSGSNTLHGSFSVFYEPENLQEQEPDTYFAPNSDESRKTVEANLSIGGAILKDRLFYFGFVRYVDQDELQLSYTQGTRSEISDPYWGGKLDWNISPSHRLSGTYISDDVDVDQTTYDYVQPTDNWQSETPPYPSNGHIGTILGTGVEERGGGNFILEYTGLLSETFAVSAQYGENDFDRTHRSSGDECPYVYDFRYGSLIHPGCWVNWSRGRASDERRLYRIDADYYLGQHAFRFGIDNEDNSSHDLVEYSGGVRYGYYDDADSSTGHSLNIRHYLNGGAFDLRSRAAFVQDSWAVTPRLTLNIGLRWEKFENDDSLGQSFLKINNQWAPRIGLIWDPSGEGHTRIYASIGRYYLPVASNTSIRMAGGEIYESAYFEWDAAQGMNPDGSPAGFVDCGALNLEACGNQGSVGDLMQYVLYSDGTPPDSRENLSSNLNPMSQDEYILGWESLLGGSWSIGVRGIWRELNDIIEDFSLDQAISERFGPEYGYGAFEYRLGNPGRAFDGYLSVDGDQAPVHFSAEELGYPDPIRKYGAIEFSFKRRFTGRWMVQGSYTYSHLYGNYEGPVNSDLGQDDAGLTQAFDFPGLMENSYGDLPQDRRHNLKIFGAYDLGRGFQLGANIYCRSGRPISAIGIYPDVDDPAYLYGSAAFFNQGRPVARGSVGRTPTIYGLDAMLRYDFHFVGLDMNFRLDVFNVSDRDGATEVTEFADLDSGAPNPHYLDFTHFQQPRKVRLGFGLSF